MMRCAEIPIVVHPEIASGECSELENLKIKGGVTATWTLPDVPIVNLPDPNASEED